MGDRHHDHGRVRRHGAKDLHGHVRRSAVRIGRCAHDRTTRSGHRVQLFNVLLAHTGLTIITTKYLRLDI